MQKYCFQTILFSLFLLIGCDSSTNGISAGTMYSMYIAPVGRSVIIPCGAKAKGKNVVYQWYESHDDTIEGTVLPDATDSTFETPVFTEKGIHYYYCTATSSGKTSFSDISKVAYTALPTIYIDTPDGVEITSKTEWTENAKISIVGAKEESWNIQNIGTSIRGRGNSTWLKPKKPYALKFDEKQKIWGLPAHKHWVLIANYLDNSFMRNEAAFYLSETFEMDWTVHGKFVDLVFNGKYQGLYWLGEAIKVNKNRVNINDGSANMTDDDDKDYLIEMDVYYDEVVKFKSGIRNMPYMIKNDDYMIDEETNEITSGGQARLERLQTKINNLEELLYPDFTVVSDTNDCSAPDESYAEIIDIDSWAKFWFVNEIMDNTELKHPKSAYFTFDSANNLFKAGPVWDFDWASLYQHSACRLKKTIYYDALFKSPAFKARVAELWLEYSGGIDIESYIELLRNEISLAAQYDTMLWGEHNDPSEIKRENFDAYVDFLKETIVKKISVVNDSITNL